MHFDISTLFWIFFLVSALQPILLRQWQQTSRLRLLQQLERSRRSRVIALIHREETVAILGIPIVRYIDIQDSEEVLRAIRLTPADLPIDIVLHTPGGLVLAAEQIARALRDHPGRVTVFVPHYAMSGGTLIALASDEVVMDPHAVLGPVDPQLGNHPAVSILAAVARKPVERTDDETLIMADIARKALHQVHDVVVELALRRLLGRAGGSAGRSPDRRGVDPRLPDHRVGSAQPGLPGLDGDAAGDLRSDAALPAGGTAPALRGVRPAPVPGADHAAAPRGRA
jgi:ClpP class serine protease